MRDQLAANGGRWRAWRSESCIDSDGVPCEQFSASRITRVIQADGTHDFGWYVNNVPFHDKARTMTFVYGADFLSDEFGEDFVNDVDVQWNAVDRYGDAVPSPRAWPPFDGLAEDSETVTYNLSLIHI